MTVSAGRKARLKADKDRARRMSLVNRADPTRSYLGDSYWKGATLHYIETGRVTSGIPPAIRAAIHGQDAER